MTAADLAGKLDLSPASISKYELNKSVPNIHDLFKLADAIGISMAKLLEIPTEYIIKPDILCFTDVELLNELTRRKSNE